MSILSLGFLLLAFLLFSYNSDQNVKLESLGEIVDASTSSVALYRLGYVDAQNLDKKMYMTLDLTEKPNFNYFNLKKLHGGEFWDPKVCSQMIHLVTENYIVLSNSFVKAESGDFETRIYIFDLQNKTLNSYKSPIPVQKLFYNGESFFILSKERRAEANWKLYKLDTETAALTLAKEYKQYFYKEIYDNYTLVTATSALAWCDVLSSKCIYDEDFDFTNNKKEEIIINKKAGNVFGVDIYFGKEKIFELSEKDRVRYFILGK